MPETTGTITVTKGSTAVTGSGTLFSDNFVGANDALVVDGDIYIVKSVSSNTALTLLTPYTGESGSGKSYVIVHLTGEDVINLLARKTTELVEKYGQTVNSITDTPGASKIPKADANGKLDRGWLPLFTAASSSAAGQAGAVPAPEQTSQLLFLLSNGTWKRGVPVSFISDSGINLNTYYDSGLYAFLGTAAAAGSNFPTSSGGILEVIGNGIGQIYHRFLGFDGNLYLRNGANTGTFTDWKKASFLPSPQTAEGAGQWAALSSEPGEALTLPAGGTWAYFTTAYTSGGTLASYNTGLIGVKAGGVNIVSSSSTFKLRGIAWRIA